MNKLKEFLKKCVYCKISNIWFAFGCFVVFTIVICIALCHKEFFTFDIAAGISIGFMGWQIMLQKKELELQRQELMLQRQAVEKQSDETQRLADLTQQTAKMATLQAEMELCKKWEEEVYAIFKLSKIIYSKLTESNVHYDFYGLVGNNNYYNVFSIVAITDSIANVTKPHNRMTTEFMIFVTIYEITSYVVHEKECMRYMQLYENTFTKLQSIELRNFYINATSPFKIMYDKCNEINSSQWREYVNFYNKLWNLRNSINSLSSQFFDNVNMLSNDDKIKLKELIYNYFEFCKQYFEYKDNGVVVKNDANKFVRDYFIESQHLFNQDYNKYQFLLNQIARPPTTANNGVG